MTLLRLLKNSFSYFFVWKK